ncbi:precorrin-3B C(17)-methyltransferase [Glaciimonas sp. CA11.2]|uniref:precorrin-3B C(17)-methyltransferase n=1 Tax=Glaciimonas sp. CA11.2 TaxID=3048601 RepID=UPI002AB48231|nr:precorrin-3B C(17)-methyltransferase [Glaciimonas sp. CA11.2]MDY7546177.1 precorrin-3B C(17)-methyltransferase [Glaciimonas sp. CA11.2]MEB0161599.1 precorrin-3B C(17)-methyltransferase [Glaciimonas sp. CA11.2]
MTGVLNLVSVGPGFADLIIPRAETALRESSVIVAYELYLRWIAPWIVGKEIHTPPLTQERERALLAIEKARAGATVALISSGDIGIYAMAALAYDEIREDDTFTVNVIPGVTSANACASLLGSPLSHDFATLSLSDLLCPWDWIEQRASHIAQADLACVLYNVQSAGRQEGVYRILNLMLEFKAPTTLCGVVKNAYRPGQEVAIYSLQELLTLKFDMLTTIVIGNRFTQRKRGQIFTPRGYNDWRAPETEDARKSDNNTGVDSGVTFPKEATWVFSGTSDGNALASLLAADGKPVVVSAATEYGGEVALQDCPGLIVWAGRQGVEARRQALVNSRARVLVDATHPYANLISEQLMRLSQELGIPYLRYERPGGLTDALATAVARPEKAIVCATMEEAAERAMAIGKRIFLATGSKDLGSFLQAPDAQNTQWFARVTPEPENIQRAIDLGMPRSHICAMQGPFSQDFNQALWRDWRIDCVVTKDSGEAGGYQAKVDAAAALGIPLLVVQRPIMSYPFTATTFDAVQVQLQQWDAVFSTP